MRRTAAAAFVVLVGLGIYSCGEKITVPPSIVTPTPVPGTSVLSVVVSPASLTMNVGERATVIATVIAEAGVTDRTVTWSSANASIASVDANGVVTAIAPGTTTVRATSRANIAVSGAASVTVAAPPASPILVTPSSFAFTHVVGSTSCPQPVGLFLIQNTGDQTLTLTISAGHPALTVTPTSQTIAPGASQQVALIFNCATQTGFTASVNISGTSGANTVTGTVQVTATINR